MRHPTMAVDALAEVDKIAKYAPDAQVVVRVNVDNTDSDWPLTRKFGVDASDAVELLAYAASKGVAAAGVTFHVGSQCLNHRNWRSALEVCVDVWRQAAAKGIRLWFLSLGGGVPVQHTKPIPSVQAIGEEITSALASLFGSGDGPSQLSIEPGRGRSAKPPSWRPG